MLQQFSALFFVVRMTALGDRNRRRTLYIVLQSACNYRQSSNQKYRAAGLYPGGAMPQWGRTRRS